jgi:RHH-type proline utilization regulon transcriptional repressor/proline dehydrogenase/delta 1-pyrroline-5-carboxylate dehydrogenase
MRLTTDIGPVISAEARKMLEGHVQGIGNVAKPVGTVRRLVETEHGFFFAPRAFEIDSISRLTREVFGPILHIVRYSGGHLDKVCDAINGTGYGLTLSIHSRIEDTIDFVIARAQVGNIYVNRHQIGAVVGSQPFGGEGLSGTGPKAGGPHYLQRFATERVVSTNTTASGGNATLLAQASEG